MTLFKHHFRGSRGLLIGWGTGLFILALYLVLLFDSFQTQQDQFADILSAYPPELMAAFGGTTDLFTVSGYLNFTFFSYVAVLMGFVAVSLGSSMLSADEERGRLDLVAAHPVSRGWIFAARLLAVLAVQAGILLLSWLGFVVSAPGTGLKEVSAGEFLLPHLELLALMIFFCGLALLLSQVLPTRRAASAVASVVLLASYVLQMVLELDDSLKSLEGISPLHYLKGGQAVEGINGAWFLGLLALGLAMTALAAWRFDRRDLRLAGEGSWPGWLRFWQRRQAA